MPAYVLYMVYTVDRAPPARPELESGPKRALRWVEVPVAYALISALMAHVLLRLLSAGDTTGPAAWCSAESCRSFSIVGHLGIDAVTSLAAVSTLLIVAAYRAWSSLKAR